MKPAKIMIPIMILLLGLSACGKKGGKPNAMDNDNRPVVMVTELALAPLDEYITVSGKLEGITDVTMSSEAGGRVLQLYKKLGDSVSKGERIGLVENDVLKLRLEQAEAALLSAQASFDNAQKNLNYAQTAHDRKLISEVEYNSALSAFKGAKAGLDGARAGQEAASQAVRNSYLIAAESGMISNLFVTSGQFINPGTPIATITNASTLILKTGVGETQISKLKKGQPVELKHPDMVNTFSGRVRGFGIKPMPNTSTYPVEIETSGAGGLLPGMVVQAKILSNRYPDMLYVPIANLIKEYGRNYVFVIGEGNKARKVEIGLGRTVGEFVEIISGLNTGDKMVSTGYENLEDSTVVQVRQ